MEAIIHGTCCTPTAGSSTVRGRGGRLMASRAKRTSVYQAVSMQLSSDTEKEKSFTFSLRGVRLPICICGGARTRADWCAGVGVKINDLWQVSWLPLLELRANEQDAEQRKAPAVSEGEMGVAAATASGWKHGKNPDEVG